MSGSIFKFDKEEVRRAIELLHAGEELFEIRIINGNYNASGYFTSYVKAIRALNSFQAGYNKREIAEKANVFITLNPINMDCYSRKQHDKLMESVKPTTRDDEIVALHWLLIDLDPKRISGVSSSDKEQKKTVQKAKEIYQFLRKRGWKEPIRATSGNGTHLVYRFDCPNTPEYTDLWEKTLKILHHKFSDNNVEIDTTVFNPARICKLWGTKAQKGADTPQRPHRMSHIWETTPTHIEINDIALMKSLVDELSILTEDSFLSDSSNITIHTQAFPLSPSPSAPKKKDSPAFIFDLPEFIKKHEIPVKNTEMLGDGSTMYILEHCLFDESHTGKDAAIIRKPDGKICYHCFHAHCANKHWKDVRLLFEPDAYTKEQRKINNSPYNADGTGTLTIQNLETYLQKKHYTITYDEILRDYILTGFHGESLEHLKETAPDLICDDLQFELKHCNQAKIARFLTIIATRNKVNPIRTMIENAVWDGVDRLEQVYSMFGIDEKDTMSRVLFKKWSMQAIAGLYNSYENPFSLDIVLVFQGAQGIAKTRFFEHLSMNQRYFGEGYTVDTRNKDDVIQVTSNWLVELGEIGSTMRKDMDSLKAFITKSMDEFRTPYGKSALKYPRRTSFVGTVNDEKYLIDETGNRRFATISIKEGISLDYATQIVTFDSLQFWAQIYSIVQEELKKGATIGGCFRLTEQERADLEKRNSEFVKPLKGEEEVLDILTKFDRMNPNFVEYKLVTVTEFKDMHSSLSRYSSVQIGRVLAKLGFPEQLTKINGQKLRLRKLPYPKSSNV